MGAAAVRRRIGQFLAAQSDLDAGDTAALQRVGDLEPSLDANLQRLKTMLRAPDNGDLIIRRFRLGVHPRVEAAVVFMDGLAKNDVINEHVLKPIMLLAHLDHHLRTPVRRHPPLLDLVLERILPLNQAEVKPDMTGVLDAILYGDTALFIDGVDQVVVVETKGFPARNVSEPRQEMVIRGPLDAFTETLRFNTALIRKRLKDPRLITEFLRVGTLSKTYVAVMYVDGVVNPKLPAEVKRRIDSLKLDFVGESGMLEQLIEDRPFALFPQTVATERPDRAVAYLTEGHVLVMVDHSPFALVAPATWWSLFQTAEDYYIRWPYGTLLRWLRTLAVTISLLAGGLYIAAVNFHHEMIPTELMLSMAANREVVPFPSVLELLAMELAFELVREAGVRIPSVIGPTIGIVGALILGQALAEAGLVTPVVIIITATSGLASFAIPNYSTAYGLRLLRFVFIGLAAVMGLLGVAGGIFALVLHLAGMRSFGVPFLAPVAPTQRRAPDVFTRSPIFTMEERPRTTRPVDPQRQPPVVRRWEPGNEGRDR